MLKLLIIVPPQNVGWILDRMAKEIRKQAPQPSDIAYQYERFPKAEAHLVMHYSPLPVIFGLHPNIENLFVHFTHLSSPLLEEPKSSRFFSRCSGAICDSSIWEPTVARLGIPLENIVSIPHGTDHSKFVPHARKEGKILVSGLNRPRKMPQKVLKIAEMMPYRQFMIVGKDWTEFLSKNSIKLPDNVELHDNVEYGQYPNLYGQCDVYMSCSVMEGGGPNSMLEAMACNIVPVTTDTGNARDFIVHRRNGYILNPLSKEEEFVRYINLAYNNKHEVWQSALPFTWELFGERYNKFIFNKEKPL